MLERLQPKSMAENRDYWTLIVCRVTFAGTGAVVLSLSMNCILNLLSPCSFVHVSETIQSASIVIIIIGRLICLNVINYIIIIIICSA